MHKSDSSLFRNHLQIYLSLTLLQNVLRAYLLVADNEHQKPQDKFL